MTTTVAGLSADHTPSLSSGAPHALLRPAAGDDRLTDPFEGIDPRFVFDFNSYDEPDDDRQRWCTWLSVEPLCRGPEPRPDWVVTSQAAVDTELGILKTGKEADVFLLERAVPGLRRRGRVGRHGGQALPRRGPPRLPPVRRLHRRPAGPQHPRHPRDGQEVRARPGRGRRPVGLGRVGVAQAALVARVSGPLPGPDRRHRAAHGVDHRRRRHRPAAGADPAGAATCWRRTSTRSATSWPSWRGTGWCTATSRRTTPRGRRAAGRDRPAAGDRPGRQPGRDGLPAARLHQRVPVVPGPRASTSTSTRSSASC